MNAKSLSDVFKASRPSVESKNAATDRAARETIDREAAATAAKIDRLREARLARDAALPAPVKKTRKA